MKKYKTVKEIGKFTDEEIKLYNSVKDIKNKRNLVLLINSFGDLPITLFLMFSSIIMGSVLSWWVITNAFINTGMIFINTFRFDLLFMGIMIVSLIPILFFLVAILSLLSYNSYLKNKENVNEVIENE